MADHESNEKWFEGKSALFKSRAERVKAGEVWPMEALGKMDWLVEGVIGQPK